MQAIKHSHSRRPECLSMSFMKSVSSEKIFAAKLYSGKAFHDELVANFAVVASGYVF